MKSENIVRTDIEKLFVLLPHWLNHNNDHIRDQEKWIKTAQNAGLMKVAEELRQALDLAIQANRHIEQADLCLQNQSPIQGATPGGIKAPAPQPQKKSEHEHAHIHLEPIGIIHTPYTDNAPCQPLSDDSGDFRIIVNPQYKDGLKALDRFGYIFVLYHVHRALKEVSLSASPPGAENTEVGVFASRSPLRPNALGLSIVEVKRIEKNQIVTSALDVFDGTPLLDLKPYIRDLDSKPGANNGWLEDFRGQDHLMKHIKGIPHG